MTVACAKFIVMSQFFLSAFIYADREKRDASAVTIDAPAVDNSHVRGSSSFASITEDEGLRYLSDRTAHTLLHIINRVQQLNSEPLPPICWPSNIESYEEEVEKHEWCSLNSYLAELMLWELRWPVSFQTAFLKAYKPKRYTIVTWSEVTWMSGRRLDIAWSDLEVPRVRFTLLCRVYSFAVSCTNARDKKLKFLCQIVFVTLQPVCINAGCYVLLSATRMPPTGA